MACRLVTLSACETGITDIRQSPDEFLGLQAGLLQAGAPTVVSTLWPVDDLSTMLLMERFYQNLLAHDGKLSHRRARYARRSSGCAMPRLASCISQAIMSGCTKTPTVAMRIFSAECATTEPNRPSSPSPIPTTGLGLPLAADDCADNPRAIQTHKISAVFVNNHSGGRSCRQASRSVGHKHEQDHYLAAPPGHDLLIDLTISLHKTYLFGHFIISSEKTMTHGFEKLHQIGKRKNYGRSPGGEETADPGPRAGETRLPVRLNLEAGSSDSLAGWLEAYRSRRSLAAVVSARAVVHW